MLCLVRKGVTKFFRDEGHYNFREKHKSCFIFRNTMNSSENNWSFYNKLGKETGLIEDTELGLFKINRFYLGISEKCLEKLIVFTVR